MNIVFVKIDFKDCLGKKIFRRCPLIIRTGILLHASKTIAPRVKNQARGQLNWSRALR